MGGPGPPTPPAGPRGWAQPSGRRRVPHTRARAAAGTRRHRRTHGPAAGAGPGSGPAGTGPDLCGGAGAPRRSLSRIRPHRGGAFGRCYQLADVASGRVYAAKVIPRARLAAAGVAERVERERELHGRLRHRHIVRLHRHFAAGSHLYLLLEFCSRGSLAHILRARRRLTEPEARYYLRQIISGLRYLHGQGIVHRDLKPSNFLVTEKMQVKIGDLGLAQREAPAGRRWGALCGTPNYLAPEVLDRKGHGVPSDVWALGCSVYAVLTGNPPFEAAERQELYRRIRVGRYPLPPHLSPRARALIALLLAPEPAARPSLRDVLQHGFFTQGFTPARLSPRACRSVPVLVGRGPLGRALRGAAAALPRGWPCPLSPPATESRFLGRTRAAPAAASEKLY